MNVNGQTNVSKEERRYEYDLTLGNNKINPLQGFTKLSIENTDPIWYPLYENDNNPPTWIMSSAALNTGRESHVGVGTSNDAMVCGGFNENETIKFLNTTEKFNGTAWSLLSATLNTARDRYVGVGASNDAVVCGGRYGEYISNVLNTTEKFNGTTWSLLSANMNSIKYSHAGVGTSNDAMVCGGSSSTTLNTTESFNGITWSLLSATLNTKRRSHAGVGTSNDAMICGGYSSNVLNTTESFNGTAWSLLSATLNRDRSYHAGVGTSNDAMVCGGENYFNTTESFNGTIWSLLSATLNTARDSHAGVGTSNDAIICGGRSNNVLNTTEKFVSNYETATIEFPLETDLYGDMWITLPETLNTAKASHAGVGTSSDAMVCGGTNDDGYGNGNVFNTTESFNGTTWSLLDAKLNTGRVYHAGVGTSNDAMVCGGYLGGTESEDTVLVSDSVETYKGTVWNVSSTHMIVKRSNNVAVGSSNDAMICVGINKDSFIFSTESFNGSTWSLLSAMTNNGGNGRAGVGVSNNAMICGGRISIQNSISINACETFNGTTWYNCSNANSTMYLVKGVGTSNDAMICGGFENFSDIYLKFIPLSATESFNGTTWSLLSANMNTARGNHAGVGTSNDAMICGGGYDNTTVINTTERFVSKYGMGKIDINSKFNKESNVKTLAWTMSDAIMNENRSAPAIAGYPNNAMICGGSYNKYLNTTESFNGTTWSLLDAKLNTKRYGHSGVGTSNDAIICGGYGGISILNTTESFNGTTWSLLSAKLNNTRYYHAGVGVSNDAIVCGGLYGSTYLDTTESFNGITWSLLDAKLSIARFEHVGVGTSNDAMICGGDGDANSFNTTESFNGTTWSLLSAKLNNKRYAHAGVGTSNTCMICGGYTTGNSILNTTESFNGSTWSLLDAKLNTGRDSHAGVGSSNDAMVCGGYNDKYLNTTERLRYVYIDPKTKDTPVESVWTMTGSNMNAARAYNAGAGSSNDAMICGGYTSTAIKSNLTDTTESFNGNTWSLLSATLNIKRWYYAGVGTSSSDAMICGGGNNTTDDTFNTTESFNGTTWSLLSATLNMDRENHVSVGISKDAIVCGGIYGGFNNGFLSSTESFNGTTWSLLSAYMNSIRYWHAGVGTSKNAMVCGGDNNGNFLNTTESFNGSAWNTLSANMNSIRANHVGVGTSKNAMICGGYNYTDKYLNTTESFNGTIWSLLSANLNTARDNHTGVGTSNDAMICGGYYKDYLSSTEKFTKLPVYAFNTIDFTTPIITESVVDVPSQLYYVSSSNMNDVKANMSYGGTAKNVIVYHGINKEQSISISKTVELFNGYLWKNMELVTSFDINNHAGVGIANNLLITGGAPLNTSHTYNYDIIFDGVTSRNANIGGAIANSKSKHTMFGNANDAIACNGNDVNAYAYNGVTWNSIIQNNDSYPYPISFGSTFDGVVVMSNDRAPEAYNGSTWLSVNSTPLVMAEERSGFGDIFNTNISGGFDKFKRPIVYGENMFNEYSKLGTDIDHTWQVSPASMNIARSGGGFVTGSANSAIAVGDENNDVSTEYFNGYSWKYLSATLLEIRRYKAIVGNSSNAFVIGGSNDGGRTGTSEKLVNNVWVGVSASTITLRHKHSGFGITNDAVICGGTIAVGSGNPAGINSVEKWDGTTWSAGNNMGTAKLFLGTCGNSYAGLAAGGVTSTTVSSTCERYNTNVWTTTKNLLSNRHSFSMFGIANDAIISGGNRVSSSILIERTSEHFDGTTWSSMSNTMNVRRYNLDGTGTSGYGFNTGGITSAPATLNTTEILARVYIGWSLLSANMNTSRYDHAGVGTSNDAMVCGGRSSNSKLDTTESFNGTIWSLLSAYMNTVKHYHTSVGSSNDAMVCGGYGSTYLNTTESFNGTIWTLLDATLNNNRRNHVGVGISNDAMVCGGENSNYLNTTESFNGTIWSLLSANMNSIRRDHAGVGIRNNAMVCGGTYGKYLNTTESFNGTIWSLLSANMNTARREHAGVGTSNDAIVCGGCDSTDKYLDTTESFDGTTWSLLSATLNTARQYHAGVGTSNDAMICGGWNYNDTKHMYTYLNNTEKYGYVRPTQYTTSVSPNILNIGRSSHGSAGNVSSGSLFGGNTYPDNSITNTTEIYKDKSILSVGTVWSLGPNNNIDRICASSVGNKNHARLISGYDKGENTSNEIFTGLLWITNSANTNYAHIKGTSIGIANSALTLFGWRGSNYKTTNIEKFNGDTWYSMSEFTNIYYMDNFSGCGISNAALFGDSLEDTSSTELYKYNGNTWSTATVSSGIPNTALAGQIYNCIMIGTSSTYKYDGYTVSTLSNNVYTYKLTRTAAGNYNNALVFATGDVSTRFNGTTWKTDSTSVLPRDDFSRYATGYGTTSNTPFQQTGTSVELYHYFDSLYPVDILTKIVSDKPIEIN